MKLGMEVGLVPGHIGLNVDPALPPKGHSPQFSAHIRCGQTAGWIKMPLDMKVGLGPGDIVLDGDPAPPKKKGHNPRIFSPVCCGTTGCIKIPLGTEVALGPGHILLDGDPALPKGAQRTAAPSFRPMSIVAKRSPISAAAELLFYSVSHKDTH